MGMRNCENRCLCAICTKIIRNCAECKTSVEKTRECLTTGIKKCEYFEKKVGE